MTNEKLRANNLAIIEASHYLNSKLHITEVFNCISVTEENGYPRYHFYKGDDKSIIYTVVSKEEREKVREKTRENLENFAV